MKPVLLRVSGACESSWIGVPEGSQVRVRGLSEGSIVELHFGNGKELLLLEEDGLHPLPVGVRSLKAKARVIEGRVTVDLES